MNKETEKETMNKQTDASDAFAATLGTEAADTGNPSVDESAKETSELNAHQKAVHDGRLGAAMKRNNELTKQLEELRAELDALKADKGKTADDIRKLTPNGDDLSEGAANTMAGMYNGMRKELTEDLRREFAPQLEAVRQSAARNEQAVTDAMSRDTIRAVASRVEAKYPGLGAKIIPGGSLAEAWGSFLGKVDMMTGIQNGVLLRSAVREGRIEAAYRIYDNFVLGGGLAGQFNGAAGAAPGGGTGLAHDPIELGNKTRYTRDQLHSEYARISRAYERGEISRDERMRLQGELENALAEGRVLD